MSADAIGFVYRHSPYQGVVFAVHLAVADSVNDAFNNEFWMSTIRLARKARTSRQSVSAALMRLESDGWLTVLDRRDGLTVRYRFLFPDRVVVYESRGPVASVDRGVSSQLTGGVKPVDTNPIEPKVNPNTLRDSVAEEFDKWYKKYPRKVGKKDALKAFRVARREVSLETLVDSLEAASSSWETGGVDARFIPHPATWLRQGRWDDEGGVPVMVAGTEEKDRVLEGALTQIAALARIGADEDEVRYVLQDYPERVHEEAWRLFRQMAGAA